MEITGSLSLSRLPPSATPLWNIHHGLHLEMVKICHVFILLEICQKSRLKTFFPHEASPNFFSPRSPSKKQTKSLPWRRKGQSSAALRACPVCARVAVAFLLFPRECRKGLLSAGTCSQAQGHPDRGHLAAGGLVPCSDSLL